MANRDRRSNPPIATTITIFAGAKFGPIKLRSHEIHVVKLMRID
jgi:hypothetical protein